MADAPLLKSLVVPLRKVSVRRSVGFMSRSLKETTLHLGAISVGNPAQEFTVLFDTASMYSWVHHEACNSVGCKEHKRYAPTKSATATDSDYSGVPLEQVKDPEPYTEIEIRYTQADLGEGDMKSWFVRDQLCLGQGAVREACVDMVMAAAVQVDDEPFRLMPGDGIIGLSLPGNGTSPMNSFLDRLFHSSSNVLPQFGIWLGSGGGEIHIGGHELADLAGPLTWFPVYQPEDGYWQAEIKAVLVGGVVVNDCSKGCHAIVDTGVSHLGVQTNLLQTVKSALNVYKVGGFCEGPDLSFDMGDMSIVLRARDYTDGDCEAQLGVLNLEEQFFNGVFTFGATVLQRYYAAFDFQHQQVGFALLSDSPIPAGSEAPRSMFGVQIV